MAYNSGFPISYQPNYQQYPQVMPQPAPQPAPQPQNSGMIWVQGINAAKSYLLAPNTTLPLWNSEEQSIFLKSTDASGMPTMKILDYTIREQEQGSRLNTVVDPPADYVTHKEFSDFRDEITGKIDEIAAKKPRAKKEDTE